MSVARDSRSVVTPTDGGTKPLSARNLGEKSEPMCVVKERETRRGREMQKDRGKKTRGGDTGTGLGEVSQLTSELLFFYTLREFS